MHIHTFTYIHIHTVKSTDTHQDIKDRITAKLNSPAKNTFTLHVMRQQVSPSPLESFREPLTSLVLGDYIGIHHEHVASPQSSPASASRLSIPGSDQSASRLSIPGSDYSASRSPEDDSNDSRMRELCRLIPDEEQNRDPVRLFPDLRDNSFPLAGGVLAGDGDSPERRPGRISGNPPGRNARIARFGARRDTVAREDRYGSMEMCIYCVCIYCVLKGVVFLQRSFFWSCMC